MDTIRPIRNGVVAGSGPGSGAPRFPTVVHARSALGCNTVTATRALVFVFVFASVCAPWAPWAPWDGVRRMGRGWGAGWSPQGWGADGVQLLKLE